MGPIVKFAAGLATGSLIAVALGLGSPAHSQGRASRERPDEFAVTLAPSTPAPPPANGAIFQASDGYAALHEGNRARRVGDLLTIVLVERTAASKSAGTQLQSNGQFGLTPPSVGPLAVVDPQALRLGGDRGFQGQGSADQANSLSGEVSVTVA